MKIHTFTVKKPGGVKDFRGQWVFDPRDARPGSRLIFLDYEPNEHWPHQVDYTLLRKQEDGRFIGPITTRKEWPPMLECFEPTTLDRLFGNIALLEILLKMVSEDKEVKEETAEGCMNGLKEFRRKYNAWKINTAKAKEDWLLVKKP